MTSRSRSSNTITCARCNGYVSLRPMQCGCGDRLCGQCYEILKSGDQKTFICPQCGEENTVDNCFRDKAVENELRNSTVKCLNPSCPWEGESRFYQDHRAVCQYELQPVNCDFCGLLVKQLEIHHERECNGVLEYCPNGCGERIPRRNIEVHRSRKCPLQVRWCEYRDHGCDYKGNLEALTRHYKAKVAYHLQLYVRAAEAGLCLFPSVYPGEMSAPVDQGTGFCHYDMVPTPDQTEHQHQSQLVGGYELAHTHFHSHVNAEELCMLIYETAKQMIKDKVDEMVAQLQDLLMIHGGQAGIQDFSQLLQTLQAASYDGTLVWKISEVTRRRQEARNGKTVSLYSPVFYTSRHGYKVCLRLYMNGDGTGKGTHLSLHITLMRGEYDALLPWPFKQAVTLTLVDQNKQRDIIQSFRPEPTSFSFQRPRNEMNIASSFPMFAPVSVLDNGSYVKDDTMFLKCEIDLAGL